MLRQALILAGGKGTRLGEITQETPKPLLLVAGKPFIEHLIISLKKQGIKNIIISTGYKSEKFEEYISNNPFEGIEIKCIPEPEPLGTGGAVKFIEEHLGPSFLVLNGDTIFNIKLTELVELITVPTKQICSIALRRTSDMTRYGQVSLQGHKILGFAEKASTSTDSNIINGGIYFMKRDIFELLPSGMSSLENDIFPVMAKKSMLAGKIFNSYFIDIGIPEDLKRAQRELKKS